MSQLQQILNYVKNINERLNLWSTNAKKTEELPVMETMDPEGLLIVSELVDGIWTSKQLEIQKIIDGISLSGQNNTVREVLLGTITTDHDLNYLLDNTGITVAENEIIVVTALATVNATLIQKQFLWKLGKGAFNPIGSANSNTKLIELQPRFLSEITADELTSSPSAIVYDFGVITDPILNLINTASPAYNYTDDEKIYYIRAIKDEVKLLYNFIGINGIYGNGASQMTEADLVLVYSSANTDITELLNNKLDKGNYTGNAGLLDQRILDLELPDGLVKIGAIVQGGNSVTVASNEFSVRYNQIEVFNTAFSGTIASATDLYNRIDILEIATTGIIYIKQGVEDLEIAVKPDPTSGRYEIGLININGSTVSPAITTPSGSNYVAKTEFSFNKVTGSGAKSSTSISSDACNFRFTGASQIASILVSTNNKKYIYEGKDHFVKNENGTTLIIKHNSGTGNFKYNFPNATDLVIQNNEIIHFKFRFTTGNAGFLDYVGVIYDKSRVGLSNVDNTSDLNKPISTAQQSALDLKLDASAYNDRFKGVYLTLSALNTAHPTATIGDYAQVNEVGATDVLNYNWDAEENIWVPNAVSSSGATNTDQLPEGTSNLYFNSARVLATVLSGLSVVTGGAIVSTDSVLVAFGKLQKQISDNVTAIGLKEPANSNIQSHISSTHAPSNAQKNSDITKAEIEAKLTGEITTHTHVKNDVISYALSAPTGDLVVGDTDTFHAPYNFTLSTYWIGVKTAPTVSSILVDVKKNGISITSTKAGIDATEFTSLTGTAPVITTASFVKGDAIVPVISQIGSSETGKSLKIYLEVIKT